MDDECSRVSHKRRHSASDRARLRLDQSQRKPEGIVRKAIGDRLIGHVEARLCLSLVGGVVDSCLHGWKADALHYKVLDTILDLWTRGLEWHLDKSLRIAFVEDVRIIKLDRPVLHGNSAVTTDCSFIHTMWSIEGRIWGPRSRG